MARSGNKQGNRKHRERMYIVDLKTGEARVLKDHRGRIVTRGVPHPRPGSSRGEARRRATAFAFAKQRERDALDKLNENAIDIIDQLSR